MQLHFLISSEQRASGAMFMETLNETVLAFIYPTDGTRTKSLSNDNLKR